MSQLSDQNILLKAQLSATGGSQNQVAVTNNHHEVSEDRFRVDQLQGQVQALMNEGAHQKTKVNFYESENLRLFGELEQAKAAQGDSIQLQNENAELRFKVSSMTKDQEDLLELLADQELKLKDYRSKLKALGQQVEISDDEEN